MYGHIYLIRNSNNGKVYIGQTTREIRVRWADHCRDARKNRARPLYASIRKHGPAAFSVSLLAECDSQEHLDVEERAAIALYRATERGIGYNVRGGGNGGGALSAETRKKLSDRMVGKPAYNKGRPMPEQQRVALAERLRTNPPGLGRPCSEKTRAKIGDSNRISKLGSKCSVETKGKMSEAQRRRAGTLTPEQRRAEKAGLKGKPRSIQAKEAIAAGWATPERIARRQQIIDMRNAGEKWKEVARTFGTTAATVIEVYNRHGGSR